MKIIDNTVNGQCSRCGECCSNFLPLNKKEFKRLRYWVKKHHYKPPKRYELQDEAVWDATCPFLIEENNRTLCAVYAIRPEVCQLFICNDTKSSEKSQKPHRRIVNIRAEILHQEEAMSYEDFQLLLRYIEQRNQNQIEEE